MQYEHEAAKVDPTGSDPALSQVEQVVVDDEGKQGKHQVATASRPRVDAGGRDGNHDKIQRGDRQPQAPGQFPQMYPVGVAYQCKGGPDLGRNVAPGGQTLVVDAGALFLKLDDLDFAALALAFKLLAIQQHQVLLIAHRVNAPAAR